MLLVMTAWVVMEAKVVAVVVQQDLLVQTLLRDMLLELQTLAVAVVADIIHHHIKQLVDLELLLLDTQYSRKYILVLIINS